MKNIGNKIKSFLKDSIKLSPLLIASVLTFNSCGNKQLNEYNRKYKKLNKDFSTFIDSLEGVDEFSAKGHLYYEDFTGEEKYTIIANNGESSCIVKGNLSKEDYTEWSDVGLDGLTSGILSLDYYKSPDSKEYQGIRNLSNEKQLKIEKELLEIKKTLMHDANYKKY